jgi:ATP phosphoribosyltransferase regulatory subunit
LRHEPALPADRLAAIRAPFEAFGGAWTDVGVLQPLPLLLDLLGEAMRARLFTVAGEGAGELCLRPDFTIPIACAHIHSGAAQGRYLYEGKAFRTAPQDLGRPVEFLQIGAEVYGETADRAGEDVEIAALAWTASLAGGRGDLGLVLGDVSLFDAFLTAVDIPAAARTRLVGAYSRGQGVRAELARATAGASAPGGGGRLAELLSGLAEGEATGVLEEVWRLAGIQPVGGRSPAEIAHRLCARHEQASAARITPAEADLIGRYLDIVAPPREAFGRIEAIAYEARVEFDVQLRPWIERLKALAEAGVPEHAAIFSTGFMRPFGYYDGLLFEVRSLELGYDRPVAAGGRYDALPGRLGGQARPGAIGCMVRPGRAVAGA